MLKLLLNVPGYSGTIAKLGAGLVLYGNASNRLHKEAAAHMKFLSHYSRGVDKPSLEYQLPDKLPRNASSV
jgi:hypothetical protein